MTEQGYVSFGVAKLLKEKGYSEYCDAYYHNDMDEAYNDLADDARFELCWQTDSFSNERNRYRDAAPSLAQAAKWIRTEHHIFITVTPEFSKAYEMIEYRVRITTYWDVVEGKKGHLLPLWFEKYEDALDTGIEEALKMI